MGAFGQIHAPGINITKKSSNRRVKSKYTMLELTHECQGYPGFYSVFTKVGGEATSVIYRWSDGDTFMEDWDLWNRQRCCKSLWFHACSQCSTQGGGDAGYGVG